MEQGHVWENGNFRVTTHQDDQDITAIHAYLTRSSWAKGIDIKTVEDSVRGSLNFGLFEKDQQIGLVRVVTDGATFGYVCDVYILEDWQKLKLGRWLMECCQSHPTMQRLRHIMLVTSTAPWLYEKVGYTPVNRENYVWHISRPDIYSR